MNTPTITIMDTKTQAQALITPTHQEVCDFALAFAADAGEKDKAILAFLRWPEHAPPPARDAHAFEWAMELREKARTALTNRLNSGLTPEALHERRWGAFLRSRKFKKSRYPPAPIPTWEAVVEFATVLAWEECRTNRNFLRLIAWSPGDRLKMTGKTFAKHLQAAVAWRDKARVMLTQWMERDHRSCLRYLHRKKIREKQRNYRWTRYPLRRAQPATPSRRRGTPLWLTTRININAAPHSRPPPECIPPAPPSLKEVLLCFPGGGHRRSALRQRSRWNPLPKCVTTFFDNRIVVPNGTEIRSSFCFICSYPLVISNGILGAFS